MTEQELKAIKERLANIPKGWTISEGARIIKGLKVRGDYLVAEVELLHTQRDLQAKIIEDLRKEKDQLLSEIVERSNCFNENVVLEKEVERLREALQTIAFTPKFKLQCEIENYAELALEGRESEWVEIPFESELKILREAIDHKNEVHDALNRDYVKLRDENKRLREALEFYADRDNYYQTEDDHMTGYPPEIFNDKGYLARKALAGESNE